MTKHLPYSLPYRSLFSQTLRRATAVEIALGVVAVTLVAAFSGLDPFS